MSEYLFIDLHFGGLHVAQCLTCRALVPPGDEEAHGEWHDRLRATLTSHPFSGVAAIDATSEGV